MHSNGEMPALKKPLPPGRTYEQVLNHFVVEKRLADELRRTNSVRERQKIFETMYDDLFASVPDHPRLTRRSSTQETAVANRSKFELVRRHINSQTTFVEIAPGDCRFSFHICPFVKLVYGVDISDQIGGKSVPDNFTLVIYDGVELELANDEIDVAFSDQLIEHLHPDDTLPHFKLICRILRDGGKYVFRTPHNYIGPTDISQYFCNEAQGFHLKEWTYTEISELLPAAGFKLWHGYWVAKGFVLRLPLRYFYIVEAILEGFKPGARRKIARYLLPSLTIIAVK